MNDPDSFSKRDFLPLVELYDETLAALRAASPPPSEPSSPSTSEPGRRSEPKAQRVQETYWNEYDNGSEGEQEQPYVIYIHPDTSNFPGVDAVTHVFSAMKSGARASFEKIKSWLSPGGTPDEQRPLIANETRHTTGGYFTTYPNADTDSPDSDSAGDGSSSDFPNGYAAHYATFPSINEQRHAQNRERLLFHATVGCYMAAFIMILIAGILVGTGRHRLRVEVDAGVIMGVVASLFFGTLGLGTMLKRKDRLSWVHRIVGGLSFVSICVISGILLVLVAGNTGIYEVRPGAF